MKMIPKRWIALVAMICLTAPAALQAEENDDLVPEAVSADVASFSAEDAAKATAPCGCDCDCDDDSCCRYMYVSAIAGVSFMNGQSGGFNETGPHLNTGSANDDLFLAGGAVGVAIPQELGLLRLEFEGRVRNEFNGVTDSFQPPVPTFFYDVNISDAWSTMFNAWFDVPVRDSFAVYGGGGIGVGGYNMSVNDTVVAGNGTTADFNWQLGVGVIYEVNDRVELDLGYRYVNMGNGNIQLSTLGGGADAGNYRMALTSSDILLQVRINEPLSFLR